MTELAMQQNVMSSVRPGLWTRLQTYFARPVDIAWLAALRALFGASMFISMVRFIAYGWIDSFFVDPTFHFKYWGFAWVQPLPGPLMHGLFWLLAVLALGITLGLFFRVCVAGFLLGFTYLHLLDVTTYLNHYYLGSLMLLLLAFSPAHHAFSLDARWHRDARAQQVSSFWLVLIRFQVATVYTFAGLAKLQSDWLLHGMPLRIWLSANTDMPVLGALFRLPHVPLLMSWAGFLFDTTIPWILMNRRLRPYGYVAVLVFHALTRALFPIGMFPVIMVISALAFFSPSWPRHLLAKLPALRTRALASIPTDDRPFPAQKSWLLVVAAAYCLVHLLMPMRFLAYGGNVLWHEQGMRWSWRVMVREKNGSATFRVRQKSSGREWEVSPSRYLTRLQEREMASQPDLILQLAHHIHQDMLQRGLGDMEVRVDALVSLNGRRSARLIDPSVDLTQIKDGLGRATWIMPKPTEPPPSMRPL